MQGSVGRISSRCRRFLGAGVSSDYTLVTDVQLKLFLDIRSPSLPKRLVPSLSLVPLPASSTSTSPSSIIKPRATLPFDTSPHTDPNESRTSTSTVASQIRSAPYITAARTCPPARTITSGSVRMSESEDSTSQLGWRQTGEPRSSNASSVIAKKRSSVRILSGIGKGLDRLGSAMRRSVSDEAKANRSYTHSTARSMGGTSTGGLLETEDDADVGLPFNVTVKFPSSA